jgi:hypothetical protein
MTAILSPCRTYRYLLSRGPDSMFSYEQPVLFCGANPSTADARKNDPTVNRLRGFARLWQCAGFSLINLYAFRAKDPTDLWTVADPVGPDNDKHIRDALTRFKHCVVCWGNIGKPDRVASFCQIAHDVGAELLCFCTNQDGSPGHPLYLKGDTILKKWAPNV